MKEFIELYGIKIPANKEVELTYNGNILFVSTTKINGVCTLIKPYNLQLRNVTPERFIAEFISIKTKI